MKYSYHFRCELVLAGQALRWPRPCWQTRGATPVILPGRHYACYGQGIQHALVVVLSNFEQRFLAKILRNDFEI